MSSPIRLGVIGLSVSGGWADLILMKPLLPPSPLASRFKLTALCTRSAASASATAKKYSELVGHDVKAYHGAEGRAQLARDPDVDMVVVAVKVADHKEAILPALEAGKDVFVEWPLGKDLAESTEIAELARKKGVRTIIGNQAIQSPMLLKVCAASLLRDLTYMNSFL